ncbi:MAG: MoxR family ATPase [Lachnospiraceae bacterium]|nr:MoxR family ATPase [Lachnospiraceae bacterium]
MDVIDRQLEWQQVAPGLRRDLEEFRRTHPVPEKAQGRVLPPPIPYIGREVLEMSVAALLAGENLLLSGSKATGKNVLAENLAWLFRRPVYNISFHVNTDSSSLIGTDTFRAGEVQFREGPVTQCALCGGFGVLDEINMAKNDAAAVLHATLDYRRVIDVPGYERIVLDEATRFIATMNYGYAGTRELNEALVSRFLVIDMPELTEEVLAGILKEAFPGLRTEARDAFIGLFLDLEQKAHNGEISTKSLDLRGMLAALRLIRAGIAPGRALDMGLVNKSFDLFEREIVGDVVLTRIPEEWTAAEVFAD